MRTAHRIGIAAVTAALAVGWAVCRAADPPKTSTDSQVDVGLLEFLGSGDPSSDSTQPDDGSWLRFLSQVDLGKAAKASQAQAPRKPASAPADGDKSSG